MVGVGWGGGDAHYYYWAQVMLTILADWELVLELVFMAGTMYQ